MRRQRVTKKEQRAMGYFVGALILFAVLRPVIVGLVHAIGNHLTVIVVLLGIAAALFAFIKHTHQEAALEKVRLIVSKHIKALSRRKLQLIKKDAYGQTLHDKWLAELDYFIAHQIIPNLSAGEVKAAGRLRVKIMYYIDQAVDAENKESPAFMTFSDDMTPSEFETFCAEALKRAGWDARVTMQSRDQGSDVIAEKNDVRIVVQCKLYARPVGNKAVQEVVGARAHERADYGIVVSNNKFTSAAEALAQTNGVLLLHFRDLDSIDNYLDGHQETG